MFPHQFRKDAPFPRQHNSPKRKEGNERVTFRKARGLQMEEIGCKCQTFSISLSSSKRKQTVCQIFGFPDSSVGKESPCNAGDPGSIPRWGRYPGKEIGYPPPYSWASLIAQLVKYQPAMPETWVQSLNWEDPLEKGKATHYSILAWRIPWTV